MTTTGCCDIIRHNNNNNNNNTDNHPNDREPFVMNSNLTSSSIEYPKPLTLALGPSSGSSNLSHRNRGHKRTKSAGNNSLREYSLYTATGLYAHHNRSRTHVRHHSSSNIPIKTYSDLNIYDLIASNRLRNGVEINSGSIVIDQQNALQSEDQIISCGFLSFRPKCLQRLATIQAFVFFCCVLVTLQQALSSGYFNSVITTIEKRFDFPSSVTGAIVSTFELGNLLTIIFVSYFGTYRHIPQWIGKGIVITGIGSIVFAIPHFMDIHNPLDNVNVSGPVSDNTCRIPTPALSSPVLEKASHFINPVNTHLDETCEEGGTYNAPHILIFILAMILIGCGGTPIFTLGTTYIDDHVKKESSSMYIGCMYSMVAFGLVCGFLLGGYFIQVHENSFGSGNVPLDISPGSPKWIGAWWAGFIMLGILLILISIPFFAFPKSLKQKTKSEKPLRSSQSTEILDQLNKTKYGAESARNTLSSVQNRTQSPYQKHREYGRTLKEIPSCMWRLLTNPVYMTTCLGSCMELAIVSGFLVFLPKYLETQFSLGKSEANLFAGGIAVPGACVGIFLGGYLLKRFQMKPKGAIQFVLFFNLVCMGLYTALYFLGCDNVRMAGTTLPYANNSRFEAFQVNLTADCNLGCRCSPNELEPVCDTQNKISYYSPCFAGCRSAERHRNTQNYSNCACISLNNNFNNQEVTAIPLATAGPCPQVCQAMIPFMILLFVITLVVSITQMPLLMITLRSVEEEERSLALGMQFVIFRLFGYIPSPIIFGNVIDSTCIVWKAHCGQQGGFCLLYNIEQFRLRYVGVCSGLKVAAGLLFFLDWLLICYRHKRESNKPPVLTVGEIVSSIISLDRLSVFGWTTEIREDDEEQPLGPDSDYNSANGMDEQDLNDREEEFTFLTNKESYGMSRV